VVCLVRLTDLLSRRYGAIERFRAISRDMEFSVLP